MQWLETEPVQQTKSVFGMQASASANAQAWAAAEASLTARLNDAESAAAAAAEREKRAWEKLQASNMRLAATAAAIDALKAELSEANAGQLTSVHGWLVLAMQSVIVRWSLLQCAVLRPRLRCCFGYSWKLYLRSSLCCSCSIHKWLQCIQGESLPDVWATAACSWTPPFICNRELGCKRMPYCSGVLQSQAPPLVIAAFAPLLSSAAASPFAANSTLRRRVAHCSARLLLFAYNC